MLPVLLHFGGRCQVAATFNECRNMIPTSSLQLHIFGFALPIKACGDTTLCWGRAVPGAGNASHLCRDTALTLRPASPQAASHHISASGRLVDVQAHKFSLKHQGTGEEGNRIIPVTIKGS